MWYQWSRTPIVKICQYLRHQQGISLHHHRVANPSHRKHRKALIVIFFPIQAIVFMQCMRQHNATQQQQQKHRININFIIVSKMAISLQRNNNLTNSFQHWHKAYNMVQHRVTQPISSQPATSQFINKIITSKQQQQFNGNNTTQFYHLQIHNLRQVYNLFYTLNS